MLNILSAEIFNFKKLIILKIYNLKIYKKIIYIIKCEK